ncbi:MAG: hypothetical protein IT416_02645 [Candidatus Pacebacteria bacterium]|nr:hypothetical protein [Candidatus Paceibacterota bacterium]
MFPIQPVGWQHYLAFKSIKNKKNLVHYFYLSWEDALWDLIKYSSYKEGAIVLIPDFYCVDVVKNIEEHGLKCVVYPVDRNFQTSTTIFYQFLKRYQPKIVIIFHAVGITNQLIDQFKDWQSVLPKDCLLIEDSVHRLVEPNKLEFLTDRQVVIDSLRKVVPIQGSNLYGTSFLKNLKQTKNFSTFSYRFKVVYWWIILQTCLSLAGVLPIKNWQIFWNLLAERAMLVGYDVIGDSKLSGHGFIFFELLSKYINFELIAKTKVEQVNKYEVLLKSLWQSPRVFKIKIDYSDYGKLRALPIGLELETATKILNQLRANGLLVRFELDNFGWTKKQKVIYLPLGPHVTDKDIVFISKTLTEVIRITT